MANEGQPTTRAGATGDPVRHLQRALRRTPNPAVVVDGSFGPSTEAAVKSAQVAAGLSVDGVAGPATWAVTPHGVDGRFGPNTKASVEAFQRWGTATVDGVVGDRTWTVPLPAGDDLERAVGLDLAE